MVAHLLIESLLEKTVPLNLLWHGMPHEDGVGHLFLVELDIVPPS